MYTQGETTRENKSRAVANSVVQKKSDGKQGFGFVDNRPEAITQRKLQELVSHRPQTKQTAQLEAIADKHSTIYKRKKETGPIISKAVKLSTVQRVFKGDKSKAEVFKVIEKKFGKGSKTATTIFSTIKKLEMFNHRQVYDIHRIVNYLHGYEEVFHYDKGDEDFIKERISDYYTVGDEGDSIVDINLENVSELGLEEKGQHPDLFAGMKLHCSKEELVQPPLIDKAMFFSEYNTEENREGVIIGTRKPGGFKGPETLVLKGEGNKGWQADYNSLQVLKGVKGVFPVVYSDPSYFIREGYSNIDEEVTWNALKPYAQSLIDQAVKLSVVMLIRGVIDKDRGIQQSDGESQIKGCFKNITIIQGQGQPKLYFFDFEAESIVTDWNQEEDASIKIEAWLATHNKLCRILSENLGKDYNDGALLEAAQIQFSAKGLNFDELRKEKTDAHAEQRGTYKPPKFF